MIRLAAIGLGARLGDMIKGMAKDIGGARLVAVADPDQAGVRKRLAALGLGDEGVTFYESADKLLEHPERYDGIGVGTRCHLHTDMACKVARTDLPLFLEKPIAVSQEQLDRLAAAYRGREHKVLVSFPSRTSALGREAREIIKSGRLGTINHVQGWAYVSYGGVYYGTWYRNYDEVHGLWLQKATHDFAHITWLLGARPVQIAAMSTRKIYGGDLPEDLRCSGCDRTDTCIESPLNFRLKRGGNGGGMPTDDHACPFSSSIRHQDAGSAIIRYHDNTIAAHSQNFVSRGTSGGRGVRVIGYDATLQYDHYPEVLKIHDHHKDRTDVIDMKSTGNHGGGDIVLCKNFLDMIRGQAVSIAPLHDGLLSVAMCLAAMKSCASDRFEPIPWFGPEPAPPALPRPKVEVD